MPTVTGAHCDNVNQQFSILGVQGTLGTADVGGTAETLPISVSAFTGAMNVSPLLTDENGVQSQMLCDTYYTGAAITIDVPHHEIHCGDMVSMSYTKDVPNGGTVDILTIVPSPVITAKRYHLFLEFGSEAESDYSLYEGSDVSENGTAILSYNRNRQDPVVVPNDEINFYHTPTVGTVGTLLETEHWGSSKAFGGESRGSNEWVLKNNTKYLIRIINSTSSNNYVSVKINYYIHPGV